MKICLSRRQRQCQFHRRLSPDPSAIPALSRSGSSSRPSRARRATVIQTSRAAVHL